LDDFPITFRFIEGIAVVTVESRLDWKMTTLVDAAISELAERERYRIVLDLRSPGESAELFSDWVIAWTEEQLEKSIYPHVRLVADDYRFVNAYQAIGLDRFIPLRDSVSEAIDGFLSGDDDNAN
jgi:hypothetical protein